MIIKLKTRRIGEARVVRMIPLMSGFRVALVVTAIAASCASALDTNIVIRAAAARPIITDFGYDVKPPYPVLLDPKGTLMGERQRDWLFSGLERSTATWSVLAQQIPVARLDKTPGPAIGYSMDQWPGYEFERRRLLRHFVDRKIRNPVVLTGDIHCNWANELIADFDELDSRPVATEFIGTSISSSGDGTATPKTTDQLLAENPFVKFFNAERGYVRCDITPQQWRTDYRTVPFVTKPRAPLNTRATFVVESGHARLNRV